MAEKRLIDADDLLIAFGNALNNANLKIGYGFMEWVVNEQPTIDPESLRPTAKWIVVRLMADAGECKGIKSATAYKIAEFAREQGYLE